MNALVRRLDNVQKDAVDRAIDLLERDGKCLIVMTTGTGKTIVGSKIIKQHRDKKILWLTQTEELISQTRFELQQIFGENSVGLFQAQKRSLSEQIIVASVQTLMRLEHLKQIPRKLFDLLIVDEAHHSRALSWQTVIEHFQCNKLGLTATPFRNDGLGLEDLFGHSAFTLSYEEAKEMKLIASEVYRVILTNSQIEGIITKAGEYAPRALDRLVVSENRNQIIADSYIKYGRPFMKKMGLKNKAICFCISVDHAHRMKEFFNDYGITADILVGFGGMNTKQQRQKALGLQHRRELYRTFLDGTGPEIICSVNVLNEGKNIPDVGCILMTRPTRSKIIFQQQIGRACRRIEGKKEQFMVLDYVDMMNQKYPPMTLARVTNRFYKLEDIVADYYAGSDPLKVNEIIRYLSPELSFYPGDKWTKELIKKQLSEYFEKHGKISGRDLNPAATGLPARMTIKRFWNSERECFRELQIPWRGIEVFSKEKCAELLKSYFLKHGRMSSLDLGSKNNLPSQKTIYTYWGTWNKCATELGIKSLPPNAWTKDHIKEAMQVFYKKHKRSPKYTELDQKNHLPSIVAIKRVFKTLAKALEYCGLPFRTVSDRDLPLGVQIRRARNRGMYASQITVNRKRIWIGSFDTAEEAHQAYLKYKKTHGIGDR